MCCCLFSPGGPSAGSGWWYPGEGRPPFLVMGASWKMLRETSTAWRFVPTSVHTVHLMSISFYFVCGLFFCFVFFCFDLIIFFLETCLINTQFKPVKILKQLKIVFFYMTFSYFLPQLWLTLVWLTFLT